MTIPLPGSSSSAVVRTALASYLGSASIDNLGAVYPYPPFDTSNIDWNAVTPPGSMIQAFAVVFLETEEDTQVAWDGAGGRRVVEYIVTLELFYQNMSGDYVASQKALDDLIDAIKFRLRYDPALGTDQAQSQIIQAGVAQLTVERGRPERYGDGDTFGAWTGIQFSVQTYEYAS